VLIVGRRALAYGGFSYTKETYKAEIGPLKISGGEEQVTFRNGRYHGHRGGRRAPVRGRKK
jgi:hypothetical protein